MYEHEIRITYYDLDFNGRVKLSAILKMAHIAADVNANALGIGFATLHPLGISFVLNRFGLKITRMPKYDETVTIRTWPAEMARGTFIRKGDMYDAAGHKIMEWASLWILFDINTRKILKPSALPVEIPTLTDIAVDVHPLKVEQHCDTAPYATHVHTVRYADVDTNMHMNNSIYGDLVGNGAFPCAESAREIKEVQINYLGETRLGDEIKIAAHMDGDRCLVYGVCEEKMSFAARVELG